MSSRDPDYSRLFEYYRPRPPTPESIPMSMHAMVAWAIPEPTDTGKKWSASYDFQSRHPDDDTDAERLRDLLALAEVVSQAVSILKKRMDPVLSADIESAVNNAKKTQEISGMGVGDDG